MRRRALAILVSAWIGAAATEETVVVTTTRVPSLVANEPLRIEAVLSEEIEENLTVQPGNISTPLNELPSARIQAAAPGLGGVGLQLRGMPTRHTLVLSDGLASLGAEPDDFGLLQTRHWTCRESRDVWAPLDGRTFNIGVRTGLEDHAIISDDSHDTR